MNLRVGEFLNFSCFNFYTSNLAFLYNLARCIILLAKMYNFCIVFKFESSEIFEILGII